MTTHKLKDEATPSGAARFVELVDQLYAIHPTGGPLHVVLDDCNIDGTIEPFYVGWAAEELDALYYDGWPIAELHPDAPAVTEGLGRSTRQLCDEIAELMNGWTLSERETALALWRARDEGSGRGSAPVA